MNTNRNMHLKQNNRWKRDDTNSTNKIKKQTPRFYKKRNSNSKTPWSKKNGKKHHYNKDNFNNHRYNYLSDNKQNFHSYNKNFLVLNDDFPLLSGKNMKMIDNGSVWNNTEKKNIIKKSGVFINKNAHYCSFTKRRIKKGMEIVAMKNLNDRKLYFDGLNNLKRYNQLHHANLQRLEFSDDGKQKLMEVSDILDNNYHQNYSEDDYYSEDSDYFDDEYY